jgi:hypothetical protein
MKTTIIYRVVLFPPLEKTKFMTTNTLEKAQAIANQYPEFHPLIERNTVTETGWEIVNP